MASQKNFRGRIWLQKSGHAVEVSTFASSPQRATEIIKALYGSQFKSFAKHMASN
jgi:hypothetical protein